MALSANTVWEIEFLGNDTNGGGFVTGASGTDFSQQNNKNTVGSNISTTDAVTAGTTTITSATAAFTSAIVGNIIYISGGTGSITGGWYQVTTFTNSTTIVVDRSTGLTAGTGATMNIGGALATSGLAALLSTVSGMTLWWQHSASTYVNTTATPGSGGPINFASGVNVRLNGYDVVRGDRTGNQPVMSWGSVAAPGSNTYMILCQGNALQEVINCAVNCNSVNNVSGINASASQRDRVIQCTISNANGTNGIGLLSALANSPMVACEAVSCVTGFSGLGNYNKCLASACGTGFTGSDSYTKCVASACTTTGFVFNGINVYASECTADSCTSVGFDLSGAALFGLLESCIASNNGTGIKVTAGQGSGLINCAVYNNTTNISGTPEFNVGQVTVSQQPYVSAGSQFAPNSTAGGGASLRGAALSVVTQTDNTDIGAVQHADPSGGSATTPMLTVHGG